MKVRFLKIIYIITAFVFVVNSVFVVLDTVSYSMEVLPEGDKIYSTSSPSENKTLNVYLINNSFGNAVRAEIESEGEKRNVFWQTGISGVNSVWLNDMVVEINGIELNVEAGADYDCRRGYSIFSKGSIEGENVENQKPRIY